MDIIDSFSNFTFKPATSLTNVGPAQRLMFATMSKTTQDGKLLTMAGLKDENK